MMSNLMNAKLVVPALAGIALVWAAAAHAQPIALNAEQMDSVAAAGVDTVNGFVCPVIKTENVLHSPRSGTLGGGEFYTIGGPDVTVPVRATNGDGTSNPGGPFLKPGDPNYSAIWGCCR
ncbi:MAG: hypothetical protein PVH25_12005 [Burkholderiales bacterium]